MRAFQPPDFAGRFRGTPGRLAQTPSRNGLTILLLAFASLCACSQAQEVRRAEPVIATRGGAVTLDDQARFLAGVEGRPGSPLKSLEDTRAWQEHARATNDLWTRARRGRQDKMREWSRSQILSRVGNPQTIYYVFGGPDYITARIFFPGSPNIILAGLEPVGQVPDLRTLSSDQLTSSLRNLRQAMDDVLRLGFFETKTMRADLQRTPVQGVKPMIHVMMVRSGETILDESSLSLGGGVSGVKVTSSAGSCYYLSGDISNGGSVSRITGFLDQFSSAGSYLKAASYLMHEGSFSTIRNFLLANSRFILQDDSGIPLSAFDRGQWEIVPFGNYEGVMPVFRKYYQPALLQLYNERRLPMPFGIGYRVKDSQANQILAIRR